MTATAYGYMRGKSCSKAIAILPKKQDAKRLLETSGNHAVLLQVTNIEQYCHDEEGNIRWNPTGGTYWAVFSKSPKYALVADDFVRGKIHTEERYIVQLAKGRWLDASGHLTQSKQVACVFTSRQAAVTALELSRHIIIHRDETCGIYQLHEELTCAS